MKQFLITLVIGCYSAAAAQAQSMLKVRLADNSPINVSVDGRYFNKRGTSVTVGELPYGRHWLKIYVASETRRGRVYERVIFDGAVKTYDDMITLFYYDPNSREVQVEEQEISKYLNNHPQHSTGDYQGEVGGNIDHNTRDYTEPPVTSPVASPVPTGSLQDSKLDKLKTKAEAKKTDTEKMNLIKEGLNNETYTTYQVSVVMDWLNFESSKVEFAEWAYGNTVDKDAYGDLTSKLSYKNYQEELQKFLEAKK